MPSLDASDTLLLATRAIEAAEEGRPFDVAGARVSVGAVADQLEAMAVDARLGDEDRAATQHLAITTRALDKVFAAVLDGDLGRARISVRRALWAPVGNAGVRAKLEELDAELYARRFALTATQNAFPEPHRTPEQRAFLATAKEELDELEASRPDLVALLDDEGGTT